jgi:hypothetical protein
LGAAIVGGFGAELRDDSGSDVYGESGFAERRLADTQIGELEGSPPVSIPPPRFFNLGIPPAKSPANCGGCSNPVTALLSLEPWSLLLRALFPAGTGGASPPGGFTIPGTGGAPPKGAADAPPDVFPIIGADRSFVTAFLSFVPFVISERSAPYKELATGIDLRKPKPESGIVTTGGFTRPAPAGGLEGRFPGGGGGGGGPPLPGIGGGGGGGGMAGCSGYQRE